MSKFKVGDKVRVRSDLKSGMTFHFWCVIAQMTEYAGKVLTILSIKEDSYAVEEDPHHWTDEMFSGLATEQPRREFIVIRRSGAETISELRHDREVIKSAKATCAPSDTFDFSTGAKLAFDRLMNGTYSKQAYRFTNPPKPAPEPPKFYTGKVVMVDCEFPDRKHLINHLFEFKDGRQVGNKVRGMSFSHAPYKSFEQIVSDHNASTWIEVKSDV